MSKCVFCLLDDNCILSLNVFVCHDNGNVLQCFTINSPVIYPGKKKYEHNYVC